MEAATILINSIIISPDSPLTLLWFTSSSVHLQKFLRSSVNWTVRKSIRIRYLHSTSIRTPSSKNATTSYRCRCSCKLLSRESL